MASDALNAKAMNLGSGGAQPKMRRTTIQHDCLLPKGSKQSMVFEQVLKERYGAEYVQTFPSSTRKESMAQRLDQDPDFKAQSTLLHDLVAELCPGDKVRFYPKYHCEFPSIERFWSSCKKYARENCKYNIVGLRKIIPESFDSVCSETVRRYFGVCRRYEAAYRLAIGISDIDKVVRMTRYTSHRKVADRSGIVQRLKDLGVVTEDDFVGLCSCDKCLGCEPHCTAPRCSNLAHGHTFDEDTPSRLPPSTPELEVHDSKGKSTFVQCDVKTCKKFREVNETWDRSRLQENKSFTCSMSSHLCSDACSRCRSQQDVCCCEFCGQLSLSCTCDFRALPFTRLNNAELKAELKALGKKCSGNKPVLLSRLLEAKGIPPMPHLQCHRN